MFSACLNLSLSPVGAIAGVRVAATCAASAASATIAAGTHRLARAPAGPRRRTNAAKTAKNMMPFAPR